MYNETTGILYDSYLIILQSFVKLGALIEIDDDLDETFINLINTIYIDLFDYSILDEYSIDEIREIQSKVINKYFPVESHKQTCI